MLTTSSTDPESPSKEAKAGDQRESFRGPSPRTALGPDSPRRAPTHPATNPPDLGEPGRRSLLCYVAGPLEAANGDVPVVLTRKQRLLVAGGRGRPREEPRRGLSAPSPASGPRRPGSRGPQPRPGGAAPQGHAARRRPPRECSPAAPRGRARGRRGQDRIGDHVAGARADQRAHGPQPHSRCAAGHESPSAGSRRCRATVRPPKVPVLPAGLAPAFRARDVPDCGASDARSAPLLPPLRSVPVLTPPQHSCSPQ